MGFDGREKVLLISIYKCTVSYKYIFESLTFFKWNSKSDEFTTYKDFDELKSI